MFIVLVRLVNGSTKYEGRVELLIDGEWGTMCGERDGFDYADAVVVCRELGYGRAVSKSQTPDFGPGNGSVWFWYGYRSPCHGTESSFLSCFYRSFLNTHYGSHCRNGYPFGVNCTTPGNFNENK